ncbi:MAG: hypothetical protein WEB89_08455 [Balneolales bacterium]
MSTFQKLTNLSTANAHQVTSHQFRKFFQSYAMAFNKQHGRIGGLFQTPFKRAWINKEEYFQALVFYIHANPQSHGLISDFREWQWSSYKGSLSNKPTRLKKDEVIKWFGGSVNFKKYHEAHYQDLSEKNILLEDD